MWCYSSHAVEMNWLSRQQVPMASPGTTVRQELHVFCNVGPHSTTLCTAYWQLFSVIHSGYLGNWTDIYELCFVAVVHIVLADLTSYTHLALLVNTVWTTGKLLTFSIECLGMSMPDHFSHNCDLTRESLRWFFRIYYANKVHNDFSVI